VLSFYALEHVSDLRGFLGTVWKILKSGGTFYFVVPNAYMNVADFVVADHINHFSEPSLRAMLARAGFQALDIDAKSHDAAFIVTARKLAHPAVVVADPAAVNALGLRATEMAQFWTGAVQRIRAFEAALPAGARRAIYGAGFYGNFIAFALNEPAKVECFIDQNLHLQGRQIHGKPVIAPAALAPEVDTVFIGLNPEQARRIIEGVAAWRDRRNNYLFL
jgi:hypothetical protein